MNEYKDLKNKRVLVTGSSKGIGFNIAKSFQEKGALVAINGRNKKRLELAQTKIPGSISLHGDLSKENIAKKITDNIKREFGGLDILVCNAGNGNSLPPGHETLDEFTKIIDDNFYSAFNIINCAKTMLGRSKGSIVCISSICGTETIPNAPITYSVAKAALNRYVNSVSRPLGKDNIRINAIAPGNILFKGSVWEKKLKRSKNAVKKTVKEQVPLKKFGDLNDIISLVLYLSSENSKFTTGAIWKVDGGQTKSI